MSLFLSLTACSVSSEDSYSETPSEATSTESSYTESATAPSNTVSDMELPDIVPGEILPTKSRYTDQNGDIVIIPAEFTVSENKDEQTVDTGLVVIGANGSEFVWIPTTETSLAVRDFGSYFSGGTINGYYDETELELYRDMVKSTELYGGFYMGRFEASLDKDENDNIPASKRITGDSSNRIWVRFSPQDTALVCQKLYTDNDTVQGFFPWGINYDTVLQWIIDTGNRTAEEVSKDSSDWGNYSNNSFALGADGNTTGKWEETKSNNIYDLAGNNWEWTQERYGSGSYVMRSGGYNLMGGACPGYSYPAAIRDPLPGNDHHPNVTFRAALYVK